MKQFLWQYPGDPVSIVTKMTGKEFVEIIRGNQPGRIIIQKLDKELKVEDTHVIIHDSIICDSCNRKIALKDTCYLLDRSYLYCKECWRSKDKYRIKKLKVINESISGN